MPQCQPQTLIFEALSPVSSYAMVVSIHKEPYLNMVLSCRDGTFLIGSSVFIILTFLYPSLKCFITFNGDFINLFLCWALGKGLFVLWTCGYKAVSLVLWRAAVKLLLVGIF